jgi:hypothetical protein
MSSSKRHQSAGWHVTLVTRKKLLDEPWAWSSLNDATTVEDNASQDDYVRAITNIAGSRKIDRVVGLDEFDVMNAAKAREHLQLGGMTSSHALRFSRQAFDAETFQRRRESPALNTRRRSIADAINGYLDRVSAPWIVKPRYEVSAFGIRKCESQTEVWEGSDGSR